MELIIMDDKKPLSLEEFWLARLSILRKNYDMIVDALEEVEDSLGDFLKLIYGPNPMEGDMPHIDKNAGVPQRFEKAIQIARLIGDISKITSEDNTRSKTDERN